MKADLDPQVFGPDRNGIIEFVKRLEAIARDARGREPAPSPSRGKPRSGEGERPDSALLATLARRESPARIPALQGEDAPTSLAGQRGKTGAELLSTY
jgi:hypothetical protein